LLAEQVLRDGSADLVAIGRGLLADPDWPTKVQNGQLDAITPCLACNQGCIGQLLAGKPIGCLMNPSTGREAELRAKPVVAPKDVVVVGGGPAGLEAARVLAQRGHHVRLLEASQHLGGEFAAASMVPRKEEVAAGLGWLARGIHAQHVDVELGRCVSAEQVAALHPDVVIVATGGQPIRPDLPGANDQRVVIAHDVLLGKQAVGQRVLVVGAGAVGMEVAEYLAVQSRQVTVIEKGDHLGWGMESAHQYWVTETLRQHNASLLTDLKLESVQADGRVVASAGAHRTTLGPFDTIVLAMGYRADSRLATSLEGRVAEVYTIGDAVEPRSALEAMREAAEIGVRI
jgi:NADPH-dependent 2,4-dienoyl-CoA reductase/sulfur reductase-like enzyme